MDCGFPQNKDTWNDWRWQLRNSTRDVAALAAKIKLGDDEKAGLSLLSSADLPLRITPYFLSLMNPDDADCPLRRQVIPRVSEFSEDDSLRRDPLGEEAHEVVPHLVHRYPDRVLLLVTDRCAAYCRFCTRKRWVGQGPSPRHEHLIQALEYIRDNKAIEEVIISGGDGLLLPDENLSALFEDIRKIPHIQIIRMATRMLAFAPMRFTPALIALLREFQPLYLLTHFNHDSELGPETIEAITRLVDAGIPVVNQTVLLRGVNDNRESLVSLFKHLVRLRVRPYYLHQCDVVMGSTAFRVPVDEAVKLYSDLRGHVSGLCLPTFVIDIPGGFGKVPLAQSPIESRDENAIYLRGFDGEVAAYPLT
jgi:lysine 2,3-aminomutase